MLVLVAPDGWILMEGLGAHEDWGCVEVWCRNVVDYITAANGGDLHHAAAPLRRAVAPQPQRSPNPHAHPSPPPESNRLGQPGQAFLDAFSRFPTHFFPAARANMGANAHTNEHIELQMAAFVAPTCANLHHHTEKGQEVCID